MVSSIPLRCCSYSELATELSFVTFGTHGQVRIVLTFSRVQALQAVWQLHHYLFSVSVFSRQLSQLRVSIPGQDKF